MNGRQHVYYITLSDIQNIAKQKIDRNLNSDELEKVRDKILDRIEWFDVVEEAILSEVKDSN